MASNAFISRLTRLVPVLIGLCTTLGMGSLSLSAHAQSAASGPVEGIKGAAKATGEAGSKAVDATKKAAGKVGDAITSAGEKIDAKVPRTEAYKKKEAMQAQQAQADKPAAAKKKKKNKKAKAKPAA
jgi:hypothetical protein